MVKPMVWLGAGLVVLGAIVFVTFVLPHIGGAAPVSVLPNGEAVGGPSLLAVAVSSFGLAAGSALVGIGLGRWKRPRPSPHDGSPEA
jgi:hypothetical protein